MSTPRFALVTTTIYVPKLLDAYLQNAQDNGVAKDDLVVVVTGDKKTPTEVGEFVAGLQEKFGYTCEYYDAPAQDAYLEDFPELLEHLPWNCIQRRNVSLLRAYQLGAQVIITIDDDNFVLEKDYFGAYAAIGQQTAADAVSTSTGWFNVCDELTEQRGAVFYHRGFPVQMRGEEAKDVQWGQAQGVGAVVAGFWMDDPDIDAVQRLSCPVTVTEYKRDGQFTLQNGTWSPFNSQNTGMSRAVLPAYFLSPFIGRYDDIWASYIVRKITDHLGELVLYGTPIVNQERNPHNYFKDYDTERMGMQTTDRFCELLREVELTGATYTQCFDQILEAVQQWLRLEEWDDAQRKALQDWYTGCVAWQKTIARITS